MDFGNGFGFWKTIPILRRIVTLSFPEPVTTIGSSPRSSISPSVRQIGMRSFIRFKHRRRVDLPHPEGPINAVTAFRSIGNETL